MNNMSAIKNFMNNAIADPFNQIDFWNHADEAISLKRDPKKQDISVSELGLDEIV